MNKLSKIIQGENLVLKQLEPTDENAKTLAGAFRRGGDVVSQYIYYASFGAMNNPVDVKNHLELRNKNMYGVFVDKKLAGEAGFREIDSTPNTVEILCWLVPEYRGKGLAPKIVNLLEREAFENGGVTKIDLNVEGDNHSSIRMIEKLNYDKVKEKTFPGGLKDIEYSKSIQVWLKEQNKGK